MNGHKHHHLITIEEIVEHATPTMDTGELAANLNVLPWVLNSFVDGLTPTEMKFMLEIIKGRTL